MAGNEPSDSQATPTGPSTRQQFLGFVAAGIISAVGNLGSRALFSQVMSFEIAVALSYIIGLTIAFAINRKYAFPSTNGNMTPQYIKFAIVNFVALGQVWLVSVGILRFAMPAIGWTWQAEFVAHFIGVASPVLTNFFIYKYFVFKKPAVQKGL